MIIKKIVRFQTKLDELRISRDIYYVLTTDKAPALTINGMVRICSIILQEISITLPRCARLIQHDRHNRSFCEFFVVFARIPKLYGTFVLCLHVALCPSDFCIVDPRRLSLLKSVKKVD